MKWRSHWRWSASEFSFIVCLLPASNTAPQPEHLARIGMSPSHSIVSILGGGELSLRAMFLVYVVQSRSPRNLANCHFSDFLGDHIQGYASGSRPRAKQFVSPRPCMTKFPRFLSGPLLTWWPLPPFVAPFKKQRPSFVVEKTSTTYSDPFVLGVKLQQWTCRTNEKCFYFSFVLPFFDYIK